MTTMKFTAPLTAALLMTTSVLAQDRPYEGEVVRVLAVTSTQFAAHEARLAEFEERTGIDVQYNFVPFPNMREALATELVAGGEDYDIVSVMDQWVPSMSMLLEPITDELLETGTDLSRYPETHLAQGTIDGEIVGLPVRGHVQLLFYRCDLFEEAALEVPTTWDEVRAASNALQDVYDISGIALPYARNQGQNLMVWYNLVWGQGGDIFDDEGNPIFNSTEGVAATQDYIDFLLEDGITPPGAASFTEQDAVNSFKQGNSAMVPVWWWVRSQLTDPEQSTLTDDQVCFAPLPTYEGMSPTTYANTWIFGITQGSDVQGAAMEFLMWLTDPALERELLLDETSNEVVAVQFPNLEDEAVNARWGGMHAAAAAALRDASPFRYTEAWPQQFEILENAMSRLASGESTNVQAELDDAVERMGRIR